MTLKAYQQPLPLLFYTRPLFCRLWVEVKVVHVLFLWNNGGRKKTKEVGVTVHVADHRYADCICESVPYRFVYIST